MRTLVTEIHCKPQPIQSPFPSDNVANNFLKFEQLARLGIENGWHRGIQAAIQLSGRRFVWSLGENSAGEPLTNDHRMPWLSSAKPVTAVAILKLWEARTLQLETPVSAIIPEFAAAGKEAITLIDLLTHRAGLKPVSTGWPHDSWETIIDRICAAPRMTNWASSSCAAYDPARSWFILGEVVRRITGLPVERFITQEILNPLGMDRCGLVSASDDAGQLVGIRGVSPVGILYSWNADRRLQPTAGHSPEALARPSPGGSFRGPAGEFLKFYEMLMQEGAAPDGRQLLQSATVARLSARHRQGLFDQSFQHVVDFGLGVVVNSARYGVETVPYGFGRHASAETFGHGGAQSSLAFVDSPKQLAAVIVANGCPGEQLHNQRFRELVSALYEDLDLARIASPTP